MVWWLGYCSRNKKSKKRTTKGFGSMV